MEEAATTSPVDLKGMVAVVTGGGRGLGRAFAQALAGAGCSVAVVARSEAELAETVGLIGRAGGQAQAFPADTRTPVRSMWHLQPSSSRLGRLTCLSTMPA